MPANIQEEGNQMSQGSLTYDIVGSAVAYTVEPTYWTGPQEKARKTGRVLHHHFHLLKGSSSA